MIQITVNAVAPASCTDFLVGAGQAPLTVVITTVPPTVAIKWAIVPIGAQSGIVTPAEGTTKQFTFAPNVSTARHALITGSRTANDPVGYRITATLTPPAATPGGVSPSAGTSSVAAPKVATSTVAAPPAVPPETLTVEIKQDETSILRQEHVDFGGIPPARGTISAHSGDFNVGNYSLVVNLAEMQTKFNATLAAYRGRSIQIQMPAAVPAVPPAAPTVPPAAAAGTPAPPALQTVTIPATAGVSITSAYRNPRRNVAAGSSFPITSKHVLGRAVDMSPDTPVTVTVNGQNVTLDLHKHLYPALLAAADTQGTAITENGALPVAVGTTTEDHVHVQW